MASCQIFTNTVIHYIEKKNKPNLQAPLNAFIELSDQNIVKIKFLSFRNFNSFAQT